MKKQSSRRLEQLMEQFPVIKQLEIAFESVNETGSHGIEKTVHISVQRADPSLMYFQADNVDGQGRYLIADNGSRGKRMEIACAVDKSNMILSRRVWDNRSPRGFLKRIFEMANPDLAGYVLWTSTYSWYAEPSEEREREGVHLGKLLKIERCYVVYLAPKDGGFRKLLQISDLKKNVKLSTNVMMNGLLVQDQEIIEVSNLVSNLAKRFESEVYKRGMMELVDKSKFKGMSGDFNGVSLMSYAMCGRLMITLEMPSVDNPKVRDQLTFIGVEPRDEARFGWQSIYATMDRANEMVERVIKCWSVLSDKDKKTRFKDSSTVTLDVLAGR